MNSNISIKDSCVNLFNILLLHISFVTLSFYLINNLTYLVSIPIFVIISLIHHKFLGEFMHEGCHYHLFKFKKINEFLSNYFVGLFFFVSVKNYRKSHFEHHKHDEYFKDTDPETYPKKVYSKKEFWKQVFFDLIGINGLKFILQITNQKEKNRKSEKDYNFFLILLLQIVLFISIFQTKYLLFYLIYYFTLGTLYHLQLRLRVLGQHLYLEKDKPIQYDKTTSRTIKSGIFEKMFFTSDITAFHDLHHDHPYYPYRKLREIFNKKQMATNTDKNSYIESRFQFLNNFYKSLN